MIRRAPSRAPAADRRAGAVPTTALAAAVATVGIMPAFLAGALGPQIRAELEFGPATLGVAISASFVTQAAISSPLGSLVDRVGPRASLRAAAVATALVAIAIAAITRSPAALIGLLVASGIVNGVAQLAASATLACTIVPDRQGTAFGIKEAAKPAATLLCGLVVPAAAAVNWRWAFAACAGAALALVWATRRPERGAAQPESTAARNVRPPGPLVVLAVGAALASAVSMPLGTFLVDALTSAHMSAGAAGALLVLGSAAAIATRVAIGIRADRLDGGHLLRVAALLGIGAPGFLLIAAGPGPWLPAGTLLAFSGAWGWLGLLNFAVVRGTPHGAARAAGVVLTGAAFGSGLGPLVFGLVAEHSSYATGWLLCGAGACAAALVILAGRQRLLRSRRLRAGFGAK